MDLARNEQYPLQNLSMSILVQFLKDCNRGFQIVKKAVPMQTVSHDALNTNLMLDPNANFNEDILQKYELNDTRNIKSWKSQFGCRL